MAIIYSHNEERANSTTHAIGFVMIFVASAFFLFRSQSIENIGLYVAGVLLYLFGAGSSYLASFLYHSSALNTRRRELLRKFDHSAIYWHIAGSYSPIVLYGMNEAREWGWIIFSIVWLCAVIGSVVSFRGLKEHSNVETICFVFMGLVVLLAFNTVLSCIGWQSMGWIIAEGVAFITGAVFYSFNKVPYMHTVFHVFVLLGSFCHIIALYYIL